MALRPDNEKDVWQDCKRAIDEGGRQQNQKKKFADRPNLLNKETEVAIIEVLYIV